MRKYGGGNDDDSGEEMLEFGVMARLLQAFGIPTTFSSRVVYFPQGHSKLAFFFLMDKIIYIFYT